MPFLESSHFIICACAFRSFATPIETSYSRGLLNTTQSPAFFRFFDFCGLLLAEQFFPPTVVFGPFDPPTPNMSRQNATFIDLPQYNPFGAPPAHGNRSTHRSESQVHADSRSSARRQAGGRGLDYDQDTDDADWSDDSHGGRQSNVVDLPTDNPLGPHDVDAPGTPRQRGHANGRPGARREARDRLDQNGKQDRGVIPLPTHNPFAASRDLAGRRVIESEPEEEEIEDGEDHEEDYPLPPRATHRGASARAERSYPHASNRG
ncbi:hypothetical protein RSOLAG1IB_11224 [Rhizoctonia solani AG-1 IB]|uniref:Uncharacterized protein n=1 Tax=Thanatephorus cucumeris (strain AG1-IB / isolate 7/3/14) TaxID=1108050 RepID=A0A0B7FA63_THACB|nr:hypothetical protein RSOLAG1IB_11224 [Rhizoctonia solani AG-1 IB]